MFHAPLPKPADLGPIAAAATRAAAAIPPAFPLSATVAVNPFLGQAGEPLPQAAARLSRVAGISLTLPRSWYADKIAAGTLTDADLEAALAHAPAQNRPADLAALKEAAARDAPPPRALPTLADLAAQASGRDWPGLIADRFGAWASAYFDEGQAIWTGPRGTGAYAAWRAVAMHDLTPEIAGLPGFALHVARVPEDALAAIAQATHRLGLTGESAETFFHQMLMTLGGWAQHGRYLSWQAEREGQSDTTLTDLLAIRLVFEEALFVRYGGQIAAQWEAAREAHASPLIVAPDLMVDAILQDAAERAAQRSLAATLAEPGHPGTDGRPALQAAFCIDVRSEVFRRALESLDPGIRTLGFAGFFGLRTGHRRFGSDVAEWRLPALLTPTLWSCTGEAGSARETSSRVKARAKRAWGRFKLAAVSSFAFVEATGPLYAGKLTKDALALGSKGETQDPAPRLSPALDLPSRIQAAQSVLKAMSLTGDFAPLVLLAGHGASVVNNPHASALHCGACGGYSGEVNARLLAALLNDPQVRAGLAPAIAIPADTLFVAALHDTTTDAVTLYADDQPSRAHASQLAQAKAWLEAAGRLARTERAVRLPQARGESDVPRRSRDWAQTRPEWGLAGCSAFIAAPRARTAGKSLKGRAFLHDYDWRADTGFGTLELILTAPVVVASWISLQYYGSTVAPQVFGGGNKLLHNVTGGMGVVEGNGGLLRTGLPWQSVHDGTDYVHEPLRLSVCIEAPRTAISDVLSRHGGVRDLFENGWLSLFALDDQGRMAWRYAGGLEWSPVAA